MESVVLFILGVCIGSFLNVLIDRLPAGEDIFTDRSHCDWCKKTLRWYELVPVLSYVFQAGKCRRCRHTLSIRYPLVELLTGVVFACVLSQQIFAGFPQLTFISLLFSSGYVVFTSVQKPIPILRFLFGLVLGFTIAAAQILPSYEYLANTTVEEGFDPYYASFYSFPVNHLATFVSPYKFGNPKDGTYPHFIETNGSIFWENIGFFWSYPVIAVVCRHHTSAKK